jgi:hypothetical protein
MNTSAENNNTSDTKTHKCYAHCHLSDAEYGFYSVCRSLSIPNGGKLYFDGRTLASRFGSMSKNTPYRRAISLLEKGWFVLLQDTAKRWNGTQSPRHYRVLTHLEWAEMHPGQCGTPVPNLGIDEDSPVPNLGKPVPNQGIPSPNEGHNLYNLSKDTYKKLPIEKPVPNLGKEASALVDRFTKSRKQRQRINPEGQHMTGAPVPNQGMGVSDTPALPMDIPSRALRLSTPLMNTLGITFPGPKGSWNSTMGNLAQKYSDDDIRSVNQFATDTPGLRRAMLHPDHGAKEYEKNFEGIWQLQQAAQQQQQEAERTEVAP